MKAIRFDKLGEPEVLRYEEAPDPAVPDDGVVIRVRAIGVNFADTRYRRGTYFVRPRFPAIPGMEAAGEVVAVGAAGAGFKVGDRVVALGMNAYAELMAAKAATVYAMPDGLDFATAAALPVQAITAHHCLGLAGRMARGEKVLVHAAAGGVGTLAVQLAKRKGAGMVVATASSDGKRAIARELGADVAVDYTQPEWGRAVKEATGGGGVDVILEMLGGAEALKQNLACLAPFGRLVVFGAASGDTKATLEPIALMAKNQSVVGYYLTPILQQRELCAPAFEECAQMAARGELRVVIGKRYPLAEAVEAHRAMEGRGTTGKVVLEP
jgi:NADPH2:quinone reductase